MHDAGAAPSNVKLAKEEFATAAAVRAIAQTGSGHSRRNRMRIIIASCNPTGELATPLLERLRPQIEAIELPSGYSLSWGGEYEDA